MSTESKPAKIEVDFELAGLRADEFVDADPSSDQGVREQARNAVAELGSRLRPLTPRPISDELGEALTLAHSATLLGWTEAQVQAAIDERQLLAHFAGDDTAVVPAFQFAGEPTSIAQVVRSTLELLGPVCEDPRTLLAWFCAPKDELSQHTPAAWIRAGGEPEPVLLAAKRDAARLS